MVNRQSQSPGPPKLPGEFLPFTAIPGTTRLFLDFLYQFESVKQFYGPVRPSCDALVEFAPAIIAQTYPREVLVEALLDQNRRFGSSPEALGRIERLRDPATVAIVTGQQAGLFTGPIYTILKALTAVRVSRDLRSRGIMAVPVFWIECDDHDQAEVNHTCAIDQDGRVMPVVYSIDPAEAGKSVSNLLLTSEIEQTIDRLFSLLPSSEFVPEIKAQIRRAYSPGTGMAVAFARLMAQWFQEFDLILLDPTDVRLKRSLGGLFESAIHQSPEIARILFDRTQCLIQTGYHAQLRITEDMVPLFVEKDGKRAAIYRRDERFYPKIGDGSFTLDELVEIARAEPERLSPNVALRPVAQDSLLPTLAYIGGPGEIAYFGQIGALAEWHGRPVTPLLPRASATIIEQRYAKLLQAHGLQFQDLFDGFDRVMQTLVERNIASETAGLFDETLEFVQAQIDKIGRSLADIDPTLVGATGTAREKILYQLNHLRTRFTDAQTRKEEQTSRQIQRAMGALFPWSNLQERRLNILHFLSRYGTGFLQQMLDSLEVWRYDHYAIFLR
jgi:bacillithiol synthase